MYMASLSARVAAITTPLAFTQFRSARHKPTRGLNQHNSRPMADSSCMLEEDLEQIVPDQNEFFPMETSADLRALQSLSHDVVSAEQMISVC